MTKSKRWKFNSQVTEVGPNTSHPRSILKTNSKSSSPWNLMGWRKEAIKLSLDFRLASHSLTVCRLRCQRNTLSPCQCLRTRPWPPPPRSSWRKCRSRTTSPSDLMMWRLKDLGCGRDGRLKLNLILKTRRNEFWLVWESRELDLLLIRRNEGAD